MKPTPVRPHLPRIVIAEDHPVCLLVLEDPLRSGSSSASLPMMAITATFGPEERLACLSAGIDMVLTEPVSFGALQAVVERFLGKTAPP